MQSLQLKSHTLNPRRSHCLCRLRPRRSVWLCAKARHLVVNRELRQVTAKVGCNLGDLLERSVVRGEEREPLERGRVAGALGEKLVLVDHLEQVEVGSGRRVAGQVLRAALFEPFLKLAVVGFRGASEVARPVVRRCGTAYAPRSSKAWSVATRSKQENSGAAVATGGACNPRRTCGDEMFTHP